MIFIPNFSYDRQVVNILPNIAEIDRSFIIADIASLFDDQIHVVGYFGSDLWNKMLVQDIQELF